MENTLTPLCIFLLIIFYWGSYSCALRIMVLILKQVKEIPFSSHPWLFIFDINLSFLLYWYSSFKQSKAMVVNSYILICKL